MRYDLTERQATILRQRILAEQIAATAKQGVMDGISAGIDASADATYALKEDADGSLYIEVTEPEEAPDPAKVKEALLQKIAGAANGATLVVPA